MLCVCVLHFVMPHTTKASKITCTRKLCTPSDCPKSAPFPLAQSDTEFNTELRLIST